MENRILAVLGFIIVSISVFLPLIQGAEVFSELTNGEFTGRYIDGDGKILLGIAILGFILSIKNSSNTNLFSGIISLIIIAFIAYFSFSFNDSLGKDAKYIKFDYGFYAMWVGAIIALIASILRVFSSNKNEN
ncbi:hypothetical protein JXR93_04915 [bacterium]|nr:hypothetical protein [bacterium]